MLACDTVGVVYCSTVLHADHMTFGGGDRHIPLLREVYEQFPEIPMNIDIKIDNDELIRKVC